MKNLLFIPFLFMCSMVIGQSSKIIGTPIKIGNLEVAQNDFPTEMTWGVATDSCTDLGSGWRLPTKVELHLLFEKKDEIGGFVANYYWSTTLYDGWPWIEDFDKYSMTMVSNPNHLHFARAVRSIN
jgi:hypothetical protein